MRRAAIALVVLILAAIAVPPTVFAVLSGSRAPDLPPAGRLLELPGGARLNLLERGLGPALVLVHGLPGCSYDWKPLHERLGAGGRRAIAYDRVGYGHSDRRRADAGFTFDENAGELLELLEAFDLSDATLVGWSYGGGVVIRAAMRQPERIGRVVLLGSVGPAMEVSHPGPAQRVAFSGPLLAWVSMIPPLANSIARRASAEAFSDQPMPEWWVPQLRANLARPGTTETWLAEERELALDGLEPDSLELPVLVIHGTDDRLVPVEVGEDLYSRTRPHARMLRVEGGSHMLPITHPDLLAQHILGFAD
jgi:non-heme chloroperoxidase